LSEDTVCKEAVLEFAEIEGAKTEENVGGTGLDLLQELHIESKNMSITADNVSNNETLMDAVENDLRDRFSNSGNQTNAPRFQDQANFVRFNLIVKKLLETLKSGNRASAEHSVIQVEHRQYLSKYNRLCTCEITISSTLDIMDA
jgi:hypothetical protein